VRSSTLRFQLFFCCCVAVQRNKITHRWPARRRGASDAAVSAHQFARAFSSLSTTVGAEPVGKMLGAKIVISVVFFASCVQGLVPKAKLAIVRNHNKYRASVEPSAADMLNMVNYLHEYFHTFYSIRHFKYCGDSVSNIRSGMHGTLHHKVSAQLIYGKIHYYII
jgi:hypothetical protein